MKNVINKIAKLIDVKSIVTLTLTGIVAYLAVVGRIDIENIYLMIIAFYFGTQVQKNANGIEKKEE